MTQSLFLSIDVCGGLGISPLRIKHLAEFFSADLGPASAQEICFSFFWKVWIKKKKSAHSERYRNLMAGIFEIQALFGNIAFPLSSVLTFFCLFLGPIRTLLPLTGT